MNRNLFFLSLILLPLLTFAQPKSPKPGPIIKIPLVSVKGNKPFSGNAVLTDKLLLTDGFRGLPDSLVRYVIQQANTLGDQSFYENRQKGLVTDKRWQAVEPNLDWSHISKTPIRQAIHALVGITRTNRRVVVVDQNNNQDFGDDTVLFYRQLTEFPRKAGKFLVSVHSVVDTLPTVTVQTEVFDQNAPRTVTWQVRPNPYNRVVGYADTTESDVYVQIETAEHREGQLRVGETIYLLVVENEGVSPTYLAKNIQVRVAGPAADFPINTDETPDYAAGQSIRLGTQTFRLQGITYLGDTLFLISEVSESRIVGARIGQMAPPFDLLNLAGQSIRSSSLRGKYIVLDFWGSWCGPCIELIPELKEFATHYAVDKRIAFISVAREDSQDLTALNRLIGKYGMTWPQVAEQRATKKQHRIIDSYQVSAFPTTMLISPTGEVLLRGSGRAAFGQLKKVLKNQLGK